MNPSDYFKKISDLLIKAEATDRKGTRLNLGDAFQAALQVIMEENKKIMVIGNGGSAAIASHVHNDLCHACGLQAMVFNDSSQLTALSNDHGYQHVFEIPIDLWASRGDLLIAISSSGKSENILRGAKAAQVKGCEVITLSGFSSDNPLRQLGNINFYVASNNYGEVEISHMSIVHYLTDCAMKLRTKSTNYE